MPILVHLTPEKNVKSIRRSGIEMQRERRIAGVYCMPVLPNFFISHQWLRELKRGGQRTIVAVDFRVPSEEPVWVGHFSGAPVRMTVGKAIGVIRSAPDASGYEIILPRAVAASEIHKVRSVPQVVGWRYSPSAKERAVSCGCPVCIPKGEIKSSALRKKLDPPGEVFTQKKLLDRMKVTDDPEALANLLYRCPINRKGTSDELSFLMNHTSIHVLQALVVALGRYRDRGVLERLVTLNKRELKKTPGESEFFSLRYSASAEILDWLGENGITLLEELGEDPDRAQAIADFRKDKGL